MRYCVVVSVDGAVAAVTLIGLPYSYYTQQYYYVLVLLVVGVLLLLLLSFDY